MSRIETKNIEIGNFYKFSDNSQPIELEKNKINFIYANNGTGKTTLAKDISKTNNELFLLNINDNVCIKDSQKMLISKNINEIRELNKNAYDISNQISNIIRTVILDFNFSTRDKIWKNHIAVFLNENFKTNNLTSLIKSKEEIKKMVLSPNEIINLCEEIKKINIDKKDMFNENKQLNIESVTYEKIKEIYQTIIDNLLILKKEIKKEIINELKNKKIDIEIMEGILNLIYELDEMEECYICGKKIEDFEEIKDQMKIKIDKIKNKYSDILSIESNFKEWDSVFNSNVFWMYKNNSLSQIENEIKDGFEYYLSYLSKFIFQIHSELIINEENNFKIKELTKIVARINELEKDKKLKSISNEDFDVIKKMINYILGDERIKFNFNEVNEAFIDIELTSDSLPFSSGETRIISFVFSVMYYISSNDDYRNHFLVLDDIEDSLDALNRINFIHILKIFVYDYKINFLIFTHNSILIKEIWDTGYKNLNIFLFYKKINDQREIISVDKSDISDQISFLGLASGIKKFKEKIVKNYEILNEEEKFLIFIYTSWLIRVKNLIWNSNNQNVNSIEFLKYKYLFSQEKESVEIYKNSLEEICEFFNNEINFVFEFESFTKYMENYKNFEFKINNNIFPKIMSNNIINLVKILFARESLKKYIYNLCGDKNDDINFEKNESIRLCLSKLVENNIICENDKKSFLYIWNFLSSFYHNEINSSLLLLGIELNDFTTNKILNDLWNLIKENE